MLLAEQLLLLSLDPVRGAPVNGSRQPLLPGLCGALVAELGLLNGADVVGRRFTALPRTPADPLLQQVQRQLDEMNARTAAAQLRKLDRTLGGVWAVVVDRLVGQQVLGRRRDRVLGIFPVTRHPVLAVGAAAELTSRLRAAAAADGPLDPKTAVLLALCGPCRLLEVVAPEPGSRGHAKRRIAEATELTPVAPVVKRVIQEAQNAAAAAAVVAAGAATAGG